MGEAADIVTRFRIYLIDPAILIVFAVGFFFFVFGLVEFLWKLNEGGDNKEGKQHMIWGIVGMLIMVSVYGILSLVTNTFGIDLQNPNAGTIPNVNVGQGFR
ncbi:MAG: hypothetical protein NUV59_03485 [Patescibacteria group bacterium]|nr:hypothetical protein [Patescibacteria group bacterium]